MKTKILSSILSIALILLVNVNLHAAKWRVNNLAQMYADFTNLQTAHDAVAAGDTLMVEGGGGTYGNLTVSKPLAIFGPGYFLNENDSTQVLKFSATISSLTFNTGSEGSVISGLQIEYKIDVYTNSITIQYCKIQTNSVTGIFVSTGKSNILILSNYIYINLTYYPIYLEGNNTNIKIYNNIIETGGTGITSQSAGSSCDIYNNVFKGGGLMFSNSVFRNNVVALGSTWNVTNSVITNNISNSSNIGSLNGNQININMDNVFVCYSDCSSYSLDERYRLKAGSPALNAGYGGVDCGVFDGPNPYSISGLAVIPAIWQIIQNGNQFIIKAKSH